MTIILDAFDPVRGPKRINLRRASEALLRQLVISGAPGAAQELRRRRSG